MNVSSVITTVRTKAEKAYRYFLSRDKRQRYAVIAAAVILLLGFFYITRTAKPAETVTQKARKVTMTRVDDLANENASIPLSGVITSTSEAEIRAESSGRLTRVYKRLGDRVAAGELIAQFENAAERAAVQQAEGAYDAAKAARDLAAINNTKADITTANTNTTIEDTKSSALNAITSAYSTMDDVIRAKTDPAFSNPRTNFPTINFSSSNSQIVTDLQNTRPVLEAMLTAREKRNATLTTGDDLVAELNTVQKELQSVQDYLNELSALYAAAISGISVPQASIDAQKAVVGGARTTIGGALTAVVSAKSALVNGLSSQQVAGSTPNSNTATLGSADASVKSALGAYNAALARLAKTTIRSPITGTLNSLTINTGDYVNQATQVAVVSNNGSLEVLAYISEDDVSRIAVGTSVTIGADGKGIITRIASGLDPVTKKIEVRIAIQGGEQRYINGQSVRVQVSTTPRTTKVTAQKAILIPLSAVKITPQGSFIFTAGASSTVTAVPVTTGTIMGDDIEIKSGLTSDTVIVKDARGLKDGMAVDAQ